MFETFILVVIACWAVSAMVMSASKAQNAPHNSTISGIRSALTKRDDITCTTEYGHAHDTTALEQEYGKRYIVHNEPETGYVILNGVKRKLKDCGKY